MSSGPASALVLKVGATLGGVGALAAVGVLVAHGPGGGTGNYLQGADLYSAWPAVSSAAPQPAASPRSTVSAVAPVTAAATVARSQATARAHTVPRLVTTPSPVSRHAVVAAAAAVGSATVSTPAPASVSASASVPRAQRTPPGFAHHPPGGPTAPPWWWRTGEPTPTGTPSGNAPVANATCSPRAACANKCQPGPRGEWADDHHVHCAGHHQNDGWYGG